MNKELFKQFENGFSGKIYMVDKTVVTIHAPCQIRYIGDMFVDLLCDSYTSDGFEHKGLIINCSQIIRICYQ